MRHMRYRDSYETKLAAGGGFRVSGIGPLPAAEEMVARAVAGPGKPDGAACSCCRV